MISPSFEQHRQDFLRLLGLGGDASSAGELPTSDSVSRPLWTFVETAARGADQQSPDEFVQSECATSPASSNSKLEQRRAEKQEQQQQQLQHRQERTAADNLFVPDSWDEKKDDDENVEILYLAESFDEPSKIPNVEKAVERRVNHLLHQPRNSSSAATTPNTKSGSKRFVTRLSPAASAAAVKQRLVATIRHDSAAAAAAAQPQSTTTLRALTFRSPSRWRWSSTFDIHSFLPADCHVDFKSFPADEAPRLVTSKIDAAKRARRRRHEKQIATAGAAGAADGGRAIHTDDDKDEMSDASDADEDDDDNARNCRSSSKLSSLDPTTTVNLLEVSKMLVEAGSIIRQLVRSLKLQRDGTARGGVPPELPKAEAMLELLAKRYSNDLLQLRAPQSREHHHHHHHHNLQKRPQQQQQQQTNSNATASTNSARQSSVVRHPAIGFSFSTARGVAGTAVVSGAATKQAVVPLQGAARPRRSGSATSSTTSNSYAGRSATTNSTLQQQPPQPPRRTEDGYGNFFFDDSDESATSSAAQSRSPTAVAAAAPASAGMAADTHRGGIVGHSDEVETAVLIRSLRESNQQLKTSLEFVTRERDNLRDQLNSAVKELVGSGGDDLKRGSNMRAACSAAIESLMQQVSALSEKNLKLEERLRRGEMIAVPTGSNNNHHDQPSHRYPNEVPTSSAPATAGVTAKLDKKKLAVSVSASASASPSNTVAAASLSAPVTSSLTVEDDNDSGNIKLRRKNTAAPEEASNTASSFSSDRRSPAAAASVVSKSVNGNGNIKRSPMAVRAENRIIVVAATAATSSSTPSPLSPQINAGARGRSPPSMSSPKTTATATSSSGLRRDPLTTTKSAVR